MTALKNNYSHVPRNKNKGLHVYIAEMALGKLLPRGAIVHHHDRNRRNNLNTNLVICQDSAYHSLIHQRTRVFEAGGDPNIQKLCCHCKALKSRDEFYASKEYQDGKDSHCKSCRSIYAKPPFATRSDCTRKHRYGSENLCIKCGVLKPREYIIRQIRETTGIRQRRPKRSSSVQ